MQVERIDNNLLNMEHLEDLKKPGWLKIHAVHIFSLSCLFSRHMKSTQAFIYSQSLRLTFRDEKIKF